jgi:hypothetical protein
MNNIALVVSIGLICATVTQARAEDFWNRQELERIGVAVHGGDPLAPTQASLLGRYITMTGATVLRRSYPKSAAAQPGDVGPERLFVSVTEQSFPIFSRYFTNTYFLTHFHEPNQKTLVAAFGNERGAYGRLENQYRFTYPGVMIMPMLVTTAESQRAQKFFSLAKLARRWFDVALFPWLLKNAMGTPYMSPGDEESRSDWFPNMPIGETVETRIPYDRATVYAAANTARAPITDPAFYEMIESVWASPMGNTTLAKTLGIDQINLKSSGRFAAAVLGSAGMECLPVVFRFVEFHSDLRPDIETWIDP